MKNNLHPAPFPIEIPTRIIYSIFDEDKNKIIIDPFGGSGTTALACKLMGHQFISIDISKKYSDIAQKRIEKEGKNYDLIEKELELHKVLKTYQERKNEKRKRQEN